MDNLIDDVAVRNEAAVIGTKVRNRRLELGLTQSQLAERVGMRQPAIVRIEKGTNVPTWRTLSKIADALSVRLDVALVPAEQ